MPKHLSLWIKQTLVYGDTRAFFINTLDPKCIESSCDKVSSIVYYELERIFSRDFNGSSIFNAVVDLILLASPWPGFIKKPHTLQHLEDYSTAGDCCIFEPSVLFDSFLKDCPNEKRTTKDLLKKYYDESSDDEE
jgi:hypothetical protein